MRGVVGGCRDVHYFYCGSGDCRYLESASAMKNKEYIEEGLNKLHTFLLEFAWSESGEVRKTACDQCKEIRKLKRTFSQISEDTLNTFLKDHELPWENSDHED